MLFCPVFGLHPVKMDETGQKWMDGWIKVEVMLSTCHISETAILVAIDVRKIRRIMRFVTKHRSLVFGNGYLFNLPHFYFIHPLSASKGQ